MTKKRSERKQAKERGGLLSAWLILLMIHGVLAAYSIYYIRADQNPSAIPWVLPTVFALGIADVVAGIAVWNWKRWGLHLYAIGTVVGIAVGLVLTRSQLWVFHDLIPLVILGYLVKGKWDYFE